jgi:hypothetical protein
LTVFDFNGESQTRSGRAWQLLFPWSRDRQPPGGCGTIFRVVPATGVYEVVFNFDGKADGLVPISLTLAPDGSFYGFSGAIFHYVPATGDFQLLPGTTFPSFGPDGSFPTGSMVIVNGKIYGL